MTGTDRAGKSVLGQPPALRILRDISLASVNVVAVFNGRYTDMSVTHIARPSRSNDGIDHGIDIVIVNDHSNLHLQR
jgi:hypothetical protein